MPVKWRDFWAFGGSALGDFGCHDMDAACWALDLKDPLTIEARWAGPNDDEIAPHGCIVYYHYGPRGDKPPVKVTWYDGGLSPERPEGFPEDEKMPGRGVLFVGDKGLMLCGGAGGKPRLLPESRFEGYNGPAPTLPRVKSHHRDWLDACKGGRPAGSNFDYATRLTEITLLGVLAVRTGGKIHWNPADLKAKGMPQADAIIQGSYRKGWEVV